MLRRKIREMRYQPKGDMGLRENMFREVGLRHIGKLLGLIQREVKIGNPGKRGWKILEVKSLSI